MRDEFPAEFYFCKTGEVGVGCEWVFGVLELSGRKQAGIGEGRKEGRKPGVLWGLLSSTSAVFRGKTISKALKFQMYSF